jgi:hypothetical protein
LSLAPVTVLVAGLALVAVASIVVARRRGR